jgi:hypothetical protein
MKKRREGDQSQPSPRTFHSYPPVSHVENRDGNESWEIWIIFASTHHPETPILQFYTCSFLLSNDGYMGKNGFWGWKIRLRKEIIDSLKCFYS